MIFVTFKKKIILQVFFLFAFIYVLTFFYLRFCLHWYCVLFNKGNKQDKVFSESERQEYFQRLGS